MDFKQYKYKVCTAYVSAIVNGDYTGITDEEEELIDKCTKEAKKLHGDGFWVIGEDVEPDHTICDFSLLFACCCELVWFVA